MSQKDFYIARIDKIAKESFNAEQKAIAKMIIEAANEKDLDAVWGLISQRVRIGFVFDEAPEVNHQAVSVVKENEKLFIGIPAASTVEHKFIIGENYDALKNLLVTYTDSSGKGLIDVIYIDPPY
ncbi:MAG: site-specific DNA-methyltransferase, partial [Firmicutes bacterium]|nr:site-specific DNA-methyltransferase [Bacillota bacterium]